MENSTLTLKIKYFPEDGDLTLIDKLIKEYNSLLHFTYNRVCENPKISTKDITVEQKTINNVELMDSHFKNSAFYDAKAIQEANGNKVVFGGKYLFRRRSKQLISKEEFKEKRLRPLNCIGESIQKANRKFQILNENQILFKPNRDNHIILNLENVGKNYQKTLKKLITLQNNRQIALTYKLDLNYVYISYDFSKLKEFKYNIKENRILGIDLNPNYLGYSIVDWKSEDKYKIISSGVFDIKTLNEEEYNLKKKKKLPSDSPERKYYKNKRDYEVTKIAYKLFNLCKHFKCEICSIEDLSIESENTKKGKKLNKLINNQWNRNKFTNILTKLLNCSSTKLVKIKPEYSSILGNLIYREEKLPDMILSSIEISRRGYEFYNQYFVNRKEHKKNIIYPTFGLVKEKIFQSLEELHINSQPKDYGELFSVLKKSKVKYRFLLEDSLNSLRVFSQFYKKRKVSLILFNIF